MKASADSVEQTGLPVKSYYSIKAIAVPLSSVVTSAGLKEFVLQRHLTWLVRGRSYAFQRWTEDDVQFARNYTSSNRLGIPPCAGLDDVIRGSVIGRSAEFPLAETTYQCWLASALV
jgi:hypothetical protein